MKTVLIHRNRNSRERVLGKSVTDVDYSFDYRGESKILLLLKAMICATEIPQADVYLVEGNCLIVAWFRKLWNRKAKIILMEHSFMFRERKNRVKRFLFKLLVRRVNGVIAISEMVKKDAERYVKCRIEVAHHFTDVKKFLKLKPSVLYPNILFVADRINETGYIKGFDIALETFKEVKKWSPLIKMYVLGSGSGMLKLPRGVIGCGFSPVENYISKCQILLCPSRYDALSLAVVEACCAGLVPVISDKTGAKEFIRNVNPTLIIQSFNPQDYAKKIIEILSRDNRRERKKLRKEASRFTKELCIVEFRTAFRRLVQSDRISCNSK